LRRPHAAVGAEDAAQSSDQQRTLNRSSDLRTRPRLSRMKSANRLFEQNDRPKPPCRTKSDECLRRPRAPNGEDAPPSDQQRILNRSSDLRTRPRLSRMKSANRLFEQNDTPKPPCRTKSDECWRRPRPTSGEDAPPSAEGGALTRTSGHRPRPCLSRTNSADRSFNKQNDTPKPPRRTKSDEPNIGGLGAHTARQIPRVNIKEHSRVDDLASASCSVAAPHALDGVPPDTNDTFPKQHVDEQFRRCRAVTIDRILNKAKDDQAYGRVEKVGNHGVSAPVQVDGGTSVGYGMPNKYGEGNDDDDRPHVKGSGNSLSTNFRHLVRHVKIVKKAAKVIKRTAKRSSANDVVRDSKRGTNFVTKMFVNGTAKMDANVTTVAKGSLGATTTTTELDKKTRDHQGKDGQHHDHHHHKEEGYQPNYNPEDLKCRKTKSTSLLERVSDEHFAAKQQHASRSNPTLHSSMHSSLVSPLLPETAITPQHGWDLR
jgi:hypothetical protein